MTQIEKFPHELRTIDISVIIPCFNGENYLSECIASALTQRGPTFEVIVVDDGSQNGSGILEICESFKDDRVRYLRKANGGVSSALNLGILEARAETFCWLSHDDLFVPDRLDVQWKFWQQSHGPRVLYGDFEVFGPEAHSPGKSNIGIYEHGIDLLALGLLNGCTTMLSTELVKSAGLFNESLRSTQDYELWSRLLSLGCRFEYVPHVLCKTRLHAAQGSKLNSGIAQENVELWRRLTADLSAVYKTSSPELHDSRMIQHISFLQNSDYLRHFGIEKVIELAQGMIENPSASKAEGKSAAEKTRVGEQRLSILRRTSRVFLRAASKVPIARQVYFFALRKSVTSRIARRVLNYLSKINSLVP